MKRYKVAEAPDANGNVYSPVVIVVLFLDAVLC